MRIKSTVNGVLMVAGQDSNVWIADEFERLSRLIFTSSHSFILCREQAWRRIT